MQKDQMRLNFVVTYFQCMIYDKFKAWEFFHIDTQQQSIWYSCLNLLHIKPCIDKGKNMSKVQLSPIYLNRSSSSSNFRK